MANNTYVVRLVDCDKANNNGLGAQAKDVRAYLSTWYTAVCQKASSAAAAWTADVQWLDNPPGAAPPGQDAGSPLVINMLLYFVTSPRDSVIQLFPKSSHELDSVNADKTIIGYTHLSGTGANAGPQISEAYILRTRSLNGGDPETLALARCAFHESMHNQLNLGDAMHTGRTGFAAATPIGTSPDATNLSDMAGSIGTLRQQWVDGFQAWRSNSQSAR